MNVPGIIKQLLNTAPVNAVCSGRIYPDRIPQTAVIPAIVVQVIDAQGNGTKTSGSHFYQFRVQLDCYAKTTQEADTLADLVDAELDKRDTNDTRNVTVGSANYTVTSLYFLDAKTAWEDEKDTARAMRDYQIVITRN